MIFFINVWTFGKSYQYNKIRFNNKLMCNKIYLKVENSPQKKASNVSIYQ